MAGIAVGPVGGAPGIVLVGADGIAVPGGVVGVVVPGFAVPSCIVAAASAIVYLSHLTPPGRACNTSTDRPGQHATDALALHQ